MAPAALRPRNAGRLGVQYGPFRRAVRAVSHRGGKRGASRWATARCAAWLAGRKNFTPMRCAQRPPGCCAPLLQSQPHLEPCGPQRPGGRKLIAKMKPITALRALLAALLCAAGHAARAQIEIDTLTADSMVVVDDVDAEAPAALRFGYISYQTALEAMAGYAAAGRQVEELKAKYEAEAQRAADEFNSKYEDFLDGLAGFPESIRRKRQSELQELLQRNVAFRAEADRLLRAAERDVYAPLHRRLRQAIRTVGRQNGLAFVINIDGNACPFIDSAQGENVTLMVIDMLK